MGKSMHCEKPQPFDSPIVITRPLMPVRERMMQRIDDIWSRRQLTNGGLQSDELAIRLQGRLHAKHMSLFCNGTIALLLGLKALNLSGEVITTPFTFPATLECLDWNGLTPVFCDVDPHTLMLQPSAVERLITSRTTAILAVHVFGIPGEVRKLEQISRQYGLKLVFDAAHAFDMIIDGKPAAQWGDLSMFSFHATKLFNTFEGGGLVCGDPELYARIESLKNFGYLENGDVAHSGLNGKMNEMQAAMGNEVLEMLDEERKQRLRVDACYRRELAGIPGLRILNPDIGRESSLQYMGIALERNLFGMSRDEVFEAMKTWNVVVRRYFRPACSSFPWYADNASAQPERLPVATRLVEETMVLPFYGELKDEEVARICAILRYLQQRGDAR